jgi:L,D-transpeptidase ErfK/SrfK
MNTKIVMAMAVIFSLFLPAAFAETHSYTRHNRVIGAIRAYTVRDGESLIEIARRFDLGYSEITEANPKLDPFVPGDGVTIELPQAWILPDLKSYTGIVINLSEMRLYYFPRRNKVVTFPIGIGSEGKETPVGTFRIVQKIVHPAWYVPNSIRHEKPDLPRVVPPGPDNPLGSYALRLSDATILIHGTNRPYAVGRKASHGCIRLYPKDIPKLFQKVPQNTKVTIIRQPVKVGTLDGKVYIEIHKDRQLQMNYFGEAMKLLREKDLYNIVDKGKMLTALKEKRGFPINISK